LRNRVVTYIFVTIRLREDMRRDVFQAIADPIRRDIIDILASESFTINAVAEKFEISRPAVSKHIKILEECGLVKLVNKGRQRHCIIIPDELSMVSDWVGQHRKLWESKLDSLDNYLSELQSNKKKDEHGK
jgi:DNA-binding transcriptional ArsR family regulator